MLLHLNSLRDNYFKKKATVKPKRNKWPTITPTVNYNKTYCNSTFNKVFWWINWICKQYNHLCLQTYAVSHVTWKRKIISVQDEGKRMVNHFIRMRVPEVVGHTLSWPKSFSDYSSTKNSIISLKHRSKKTHIFWEETLPSLWKQNFTPFSQTRASQTPHFFLGAFEFF